MHCEIHLLLDGIDTEWGIRAVVRIPKVAVDGPMSAHLMIMPTDMLYAGYDPTNQWDWVEIGDMIAHEAGHAVGLHHDSTASEEYWTGHGTKGEATYYAPIMGWTWYGPSTWDRGENNGATNTQDDLEIITNDAVGNPNGFGYRTDDHGSNTGSATPITDGVLAEGIIERNTTTSTTSRLRCQVRAMLRSTLIPTTWTQLMCNRHQPSQ